MAETGSALTVSIADLKELTNSTYADAVLYVKLFDDRGDKLSTPVLEVWTGALVRSYSVVVKKDELLEYVQDVLDDKAFEIYLEAFNEDMQEAIDEALAEEQ